MIFHEATIKGLSKAVFSFEGLTWKDLLGLTFMGDGRIQFLVGC